MPDITRPEFRPIPIRNPSSMPSARSQSLNPSSRVGGHLAGRRHRPIGVVDVLDRRTEHGHEAVAEVVHERAAVIEDGVAHRPLDIG